MRKPLAIIPARGGSKRLHKKNIALLDGKPLLVWTIESAMASGIFDTIRVSSEDEEILKTAESAGALPFERPANLSRDDITLTHFLAETLKNFDFTGGGYTDLYLLLPTSPFRRGTTIVHAWEFYLNSGAGGLMSIINVPHPPQWALTIDNTALKPLYPADYEKSRMDLTPAYMHDGGHIIADINKFLQTGNFLGLHPAAFPSPEDETIDINTEIDLKWAEFLLQNGLYRK